MLTDGLTENRDERKEADQERHGEEDQHQRVELVLGLLPNLLVQRVGRHRVVVVVEVPGGHGGLVLALKCEQEIVIKVGCFTQYTIY